MRSSQDQELHIFTVSVNYLDELEYITPYILQRDFTTWTLITSPEDKKTQEHIHALKKADCRIRQHITDKFYTHGVFNKAAGLNDALYSGPDPGENVWWLFLDSDIIVVNDVPLNLLKKGYLHGAFRRLWTDFHKNASLPPVEEIPLEHGTVGIGFFCLVHSLDPRHTQCSPFKEHKYTTAASYDMEYLLRWPEHLTCYLPVELIHLGVTYNRWMGELSWENCRNERTSTFKIELFRRHFFQ